MYKRGLCNLALLVCYTLFRWRSQHSSLKKCWKSSFGWDSCELNLSLGVKLVLQLQDLVNYPIVDVTGWEAPLMGPDSGLVFKFRGSGQQNNKRSSTVQLCIRNGPICWWEKEWEEGKLRRRKMNFSLPHKYFVPTLWVAFLFCIYVRIFKSSESLTWVCPEK